MAGSNKFYGCVLKSSVLASCMNSQIFLCQFCGFALHVAIFMDLR